MPATPGRRLSHIVVSSPRTTTPRSPMAKATTSKSTKSSTGKAAKVRAKSADGKGAKGGSVVPTASPASGEGQAIDIGISAQDRRKIATELSKFLADAYTLYLKTHN